MARTHFCETCGRDFTNRLCPRCGQPPSGSTATRDDIVDDIVEKARDQEAERHRREYEASPVSDPDGSLDTMIERASKPSLATLLKRGIESGFIKPTHDYRAGNVSNP